MPNLRRPVNNACSRNYLNACNCVVDYDTISAPLHWPSPVHSLSHSIHALQLLYRLLLTQTISFRAIDCDHKHLVFSRRN